MLDAHPHISCGPETLFLTWMLVAEQNNWRRLVRFGLTQDQWRAHVRELFSWVHLQHAQRQGKIRWADKSPGYAVLLDYIDSLYPDCQVVHMVRDPRDVIDSWRRRWGVVSARRVPHEWPRHVRAAQAFGAAHPERYREVRYEALATEPEQVLRSLLAWLGEPWDDAVLHFGRDELHDEEYERALWLGRPPPATDDVSPHRQRPDPEVREGDYGKPAGVFASSIGVGGHPLNFVYLLRLRASAGDLVRALGYR